MGSYRRSGLQKLLEPLEQSEFQTSDGVAKGLEAGGEDDGMMTSQGTPMAESIAMDGAQQVRGAEDERVSNVQRVQGFGNRASNGSGGIAGTVVQNGGAAEDMGVETFGTGPRVAEDDSGGTQDEKPPEWLNMTRNQKRKWRKLKEKEQRK